MYNTDIIKDIFGIGKKKGSVSMTNTSDVKVVKMDNHKKVKKSIDGFLNECKSENTRKNYIIDIKQFFNYMSNKDMEQLVERDLYFNRSDISNYRKHLTEVYNSNTTINRKIFTLSKLFKYLEIEGFDVNPRIFEIEKLNENFRSTGMLYPQEIDIMIEEVKKTRKGMEKAFLIELAFKTSLRLNALEALEWTDFRKSNGVYIIEVMDKGKKNIKPIEAELFDRLCELKKLKYRENKQDNLVFTLDRSTIFRMINDLVEKLNLDPLGNRNIGFHSIKKAGIMEVGNITGGDIGEMAQQGNHSEQTMLKYYYEYKQNPAACASLQIGKEIDLSKLEELSKEELIEVIKSSDRISQMGLLRVLNKKSRETD